MKKFAVLIALCCCYVVSVNAESCGDKGFERLDEFDEIKTALNNRRIEATATAPPSPGEEREEWNEDHCDFDTSGALFKVGTEDPPPKHPERPSVDPRAYRGFWAIAGSGTNRFVQYDYGPSLPIYQWTLWQNSGGDLCWQESRGGTDAIAIDRAPIGGIPSGLPCNNP